MSKAPRTAAMARLLARKVMGHGEKNRPADKAGREISRNREVFFEG